jgi:hypothetical protein
VVTFKSFKRLKDRLDKPPGAIYQNDTTRVKNRIIPSDVRHPGDLQNILPDHRTWLKTEGKSGVKGGQILNCELPGPLIDSNIESKRGLK